MPRRAQEGWMDVWEPDLRHKRCLNWKNNKRASVTQWECIFCSLHFIALHHQSEFEVSYCVPGLAKQIHAELCTRYSISSEILVHHKQCTNAHAKGWPAQNSTAWDEPDREASLCVTCLGQEGCMGTNCTAALEKTSLCFHSFPNFHFSQICTSSVSPYMHQQCNKQKNLSYNQASIQGRRKLTTVAPKLLEGLCWTYVCGKQKFPNLSKTPSFL